MRFSIFLFAFSVLELSCMGIQWEPLIDFNDVFIEYHTAADDVAYHIESLLQNAASDSKNFIDNLRKMTLETETARNFLLCSPGRISNSESFSWFEKYFKTQVSRLEVPLLVAITEIRQRLRDVSSDIKIYQKIADNKYFSCNLFHENCTETAEEWLKGVVSSLSCRVHTKCNLTQKIQKRMVDETPPERRPAEPCSRLSVSLFHCENSFCIDKLQICDGHNDCGDGSDEYDCPIKVFNDTTNCGLGLGTYLCDNGNCISMSLTCDGKDDCGDGSDEGGNCTGSCFQTCHPRGVCFLNPRDPVCISGCPLGTFETTTGCGRKLETMALSISQLIEDIPLIISRHSAAFVRLKTKAIQSIASLNQCVHPLWSRLEYSSLQPAPVN